MSLSSPKYIAFLLIVFLLFYSLRAGAPRRWLLIIASYLFYLALSSCYVTVLLAVTVVTYYGALALRSKMAQTRSSLLFTLLVVILLTPLIVFKYLGPVLELGVVSRPWPHPGLAPILSIAFPVGISFFTFAALGYLIDVYLEILEPERSPGRVALFLSFFPIISAGPIERGGHLIPQLSLDKPFSSKEALQGLRLMFIGLLLKVIVADTLRGPADLIFAHPAQCLPMVRLVGLLYYAFYLYSDFAGYSLIAIGSARMFGLEVNPNFTQPFLSATVPEFWRHWHMSLSFWIRDYLFMPLRTSFRNYKNWGMAAALVISFAVLGIWHGAKWGYLIFGLMHGTILTISSFTLARRNAFWAKLRMPPALLHGLRVPLTFMLVSLTWVVYRANTLQDAVVIYKGLFTLNIPQAVATLGRFYLFHRSPVELEALGSRATITLIAFVIAGDVLARKRMTLEKFPVLLQIVIYNVGLIALFSAWITGGGYAPFEYYKF